jgi:hypothetical protein
MLSWLPADTETLVGATGPLQMPKMSRDAEGHLSIDNSPDVVRDFFRQYFLLLLVARLEREFKDAPIAAAIEGSRTFRPPNGLGMATYQGGLIAVFKDDITTRAAAFCVRYSGVAHFDHLIWPTWVVILCIIRPGFGLTGCETYSCPP